LTFLLQYITVPFLAALYRMVAAYCKVRISGRAALLLAKDWAGKQNVNMSKFSALTHIRFALESKFFMELIVTIM